MRTMRSPTPPTRSVRRRRAPLLPPLAPLIVSVTDLVTPRPSLGHLSTRRTPPARAWSRPLPPAPPAPLRRPGSGGMKLSRMTTPSFSAHNPTRFCDPPTLMLQARALGGRLAPLAERLIKRALTKRALPNLARRLLFRCSQTMVLLVLLLPTPLVPLVRATAPTLRLFVMFLTPRLFARLATFAKVVYRQTNCSTFSSCAIYFRMTSPQTALARKPIG